PSMTMFTAEATEPGERPQIGRLILLGGVCLLPPILVIEQAIRDKPLYLAVTLTAMVLLANLVVARFSYLAARAGRAADREAALSRYSAELLRARGRNELIAVAGRATSELAGEGRGRLILTGSERPPTGHAISVPVEVRGDITAVLVADVHSA